MWCLYPVSIYPWQARHPLAVAEFISGALSFHPRSRFALKDMMYSRWLCIAERLEKPANMAALFDFGTAATPGERESEGVRAVLVGKVAWSYAPTKQIAVPVPTSKGHVQMNRVQWQQQVVEDDSIAACAAAKASAQSRVAAKLQAFDNITAGTSQHLAGGLVSSLRRSYNVPTMAANMAAAVAVTSATAQALAKPRQAQLESADGRPIHRGVYAVNDDVASLVNQQQTPFSAGAGECKMVDDILGASSLSVKRVQLPGTHITLSPLSAAVPAPGCNSMFPSKEQQLRDISFHDGSAPHVPLLHMQPKKARAPSSDYSRPLHLKASLPSKQAQPGPVLGAFGTVAVTIDQLQDDGSQANSCNYLAELERSAQKEQCGTTQVGSFTIMLV